MADYLPPGACDKEAAAAEAAKQAAHDAQENYNNAVGNTNGGMWTSGGLWGSMIGCGFTGPAAPACVGATGAGEIGAMFWTASGIGTEAAALKDLDKALDDYDDAVDKYCECVKANMTSVPD
jgi:uncharacterized membrane protein